MDGFRLVGSLGYILFDFCMSDEEISSCGNNTGGQHCLMVQGVEAGHESVYHLCGLGQVT